MLRGLPDLHRQSFQLRGHQGGPRGLQAVFQELKPLRLPILDRRLDFGKVTGFVCVWNCTVFDLHALYGSSEWKLKKTHLFDRVQKKNFCGRLLFPMFLSWIIFSNRILGKGILFVLPFLRIIEERQSNCFKIVQVRLMKKNFVSFWKVRTISRNVNLSTSWFQWHTELPS